VGAPRCDAKGLASGFWNRTVEGIESIQSNRRYGLNKLYFASVKAGTHRHSFVMRLILTVIVVDDANGSRIERDKIQVAPMGELTVKVFRMRAGKRTAGSKTIGLSTEDASLEVAEKAVKGRSLSHHTS
jgi:hypothetical protein